MTPDMLRALTRSLSRYRPARAASLALAISARPRLSMTSPDVDMPSMLGSPSHSAAEYLHVGARRRPNGRYSEGNALPKSTTCGQPTAAAACAGPESTE